MAQAWRQVKAFQARMTLVFADGEPLMEEMISEKQMPPSEIPSIRCVRVGNTGHTFRALWAQQLLQDLIDREVESSIQQRTTSVRLHGADSSHPATKGVEMMPAEVLVAVGHAGLVDTSCGK
jgi:hypothetical protein